VTFHTQINWGGTARPDRVGTAFPRKKVTHLQGKMRLPGPRKKKEWVGRLRGGKTGESEKGKDERGSGEEHLKGAVSDGTTSLGGSVRKTKLGKDRSTTGVPLL